jgi:MFS family permease
MTLFWANIASVIMSFLENAIWLMIGLRLLAGFASGGRPRLAWMLGALAGAAVLVVRVLAPLVTTWVESGQVFGWASRFVSLASWVLLAIAMAAGIGRGRERRRPRPRRLRLFILNPTR